MSTTSTPIPEQEIPVEKPPGDAVKRLYNYSTWVHVGAGAEQCADGENGECADPLHFHAWCRLPNPYQLDDIRRRALAAKARRGRQLRDPETDSHAVLEDELDAIARRGDIAREECIEELCAKDWWDNYFAAAKDVQELQDDDGKTLTWAHITEDQERYGVLSAMASEDRPADEWGELVRRLAAYQGAVEERFNELLAPLRESLEAKDISALIDLVRDQRIDVDCGREFIAAYAAQCWLACTYRKPNGEQTWDSYGALYVAAPEAQAAVKAAFEDLQRTEQEAARGN